MCSRYIIYVLFPKEMFLQKKENGKAKEGAHDMMLTRCTQLQI